MKRKDIAKAIKAIKAEYYGSADQTLKQIAINAIIALEKLYQAAKD